MRCRPLATLVGGRSTELSRYHRLIIDPVTAVMPDANHWQNVSAAQRLQATILARDAFTAALSGDLPVTSEVDDDVLRLRFVVEEVQPASLVGVSLTHSAGRSAIELAQEWHWSRVSAPHGHGSHCRRVARCAQRCTRRVLLDAARADPAKLVAVATQEDAMKAAIVALPPSLPLHWPRARAGAENSPPEQAADSR